MFSPEVGTHRCNVGDVVQWKPHVSGALHGVDVCVWYPYVEDVTLLLFLYYVSDVVAYSVTLPPTITHCVLHRGVSIAIRLRRIVCYHFRPCVFARKYRGDVEPQRDRGVKNNNKNQV